MRTFKARRWRESVTCNPISPRYIDQRNSRLQRLSTIPDTPKTNPRSDFKIIIPTTCRWLICAECKLQPHPTHRLWGFSTGICRQGWLLQSTTMYIGNSGSIHTLFDLSLCDHFTLGWSISHRGLSKSTALRSSAAGSLAVVLRGSECLGR